MIGELDRERVGRQAVIEVALRAKLPSLVVTVSTSAAAEEPPLKVQAVPLLPKPAMEVTGAASARVVPLPRVIWLVPKASVDPRKSFPTLTIVWPLWVLDPATVRVPEPAFRKTPGAEPSANEPRKFEGRLFELPTINVLP